MLSEETTSRRSSTSFLDLLKVLWRRLWVILLIAVVLTGSAVGFSLLQTPTYEASIQILIGQENVEDAPNNLGGDIQGLQQMTQTMADAVGTRPVAQAVVEELNLTDTSAEALLENLRVQPNPGTMFVEVYYRDTDPARAQQIADAFGEVFSSQVSEVSPSAYAITATVWEQAVLPDAPVSPNPLRNGAVALILGLFLGIALAFLLEYLDDSWDSPEEVERVSGAPTFGIIPEFDIPKTKKGAGK
jgi:capsular polysaccharide biosynthesis protein